MIKSNIFDTIKRRRSIRKYSDKEIEKEKLELILESARLAPSATNQQKWFFYVIKDLETRIKIAMSMPMGANQFVKDSPVVVVGCTRPSDLLHKVASVILQKSWVETDVAIALEHMVLAAAELDVGSCWLGIFDEKKIKEILNIPKNNKIVALLTLGYPETPSTEESIGGIAPRPRVELDNIVKVI